MKNFGIIILRKNERGLLGMDLIIVFIALAAVIGIPLWLVIKTLSDNFYDSLVWPRCRTNIKYLQYYVQYPNNPKKVWNLIKKDIKEREYLNDCAMRQYEEMIRRFEK